MGREREKVGEGEENVGRRERKLRAKHTETKEENQQPQQRNPVNSGKARGDEEDRDSR